LRREDTLYDSITGAVIDREGCGDARLIRANSADAEETSDRY
jgi:hypothetical protein